MQYNNRRKKATRLGKSHQLKNPRTRIRIVACIAYLEDPAIRERLQILVDSTTDCTAAHIAYRNICYKKYIRPIYEDPQGMAGRKGLSQKVVSQLFLNDVAITIFDDSDRELCVTSTGVRKNSPQA